MKRRNPYPYFTDCEDAFEALLREFYITDVKTLKKDFLSKYDFDDANFSRIKNKNVKPIFIEALTNILNAQSYEDFVDAVDFIEDFISVSQSEEEIRQRFNISEAERRYLARRFNVIHMSLPIQFPLKNHEVHEDIQVLHFFDEKALDLIKKGLKGRATPSRIALTRAFSDAYLEGNGYIFAYPYDGDLKSVKQNIHSYVVKSRYLLIAQASKAISFYHYGDDERQFVVPVKCIKEYEIIDLGEDFRMLYFGGLYGEEMHSFGDFIPCDLCEQYFHLEPSNLKQDFYVCNECLEEHYEEE